MTDKKLIKVDTHSNTFENRTKMYFTQDKSQFVSTSCILYRIVIYVIDQLNIYLNFRAKISVKFEKELTSYFH